MGTTLRVPKLAKQYQKWYTIDTQQVTSIIGSPVDNFNFRRYQMRNKIAPCGTIAGYSRHRKRNQEVCELCHRAQQEYAIEYNFNRNLKRAKLAEYARRNKEHELNRSMLAMEVLASGRKTA